MIAKLSRLASKAVLSVPALTVAAGLASGACAAARDKPAIEVDDLQWSTAAFRDAVEADLRGRDR